MTVQRLRPAIVTDPYSGLPTGDDWTDPEVVDLAGYLVGWESSAGLRDPQALGSENPRVNRDMSTSRAILVRPGGVPSVEVVRGDRIRAKGYDWTVVSNPMTEEYADLLGVGLISSPDAGTTWSLTLREG